MTHYITGDCDSTIAAIDPNHNSYKPMFQHVFEEVFPSTYVEVEQEDENGKKTLRYFDLARRRFVDFD